MRIRFGLRPLLALVLCLGAGSVAAPAAAAPAPDEVVISISGEAGDPVTGGQTHVWHSGTDHVRLTRLDDGLHLVAKGVDGTTSDFRLAARGGDRFTFGSYVDATTSPTDGHPLLNVAVGDRSCRGTNGEFQVLDTSSDLERLWILFELRCPDAPGSAFGEIRINTFHDSALLVAPARIDLPTQAAGTGGLTAAVTLINIGTEPITFGTAQIVGRPVKTETSPVGDDKLGTAGYLSFAISDNTCTTLPPGQRCVVLVTYRPLLPGPVEASLVLPDSTPAGRHQMSLAGFAA